MTIDQIIEEVRTNEEYGSTTIHMVGCLEDDGKRYIYFSGIDFDDPAGVSVEQLSSYYDNFLF